METVTIVNTKQLAGYLLSGIKPIAIDIDIETKKVLYIFNKNDTINSGAWYKWKNGTLI